ncbi:hypothetical protein CU098_006575, partial [Rhizopus stolonifer]
LNLYEENSYLFEQHSESKNTEYDYVGAVWAPLFRKIIYLNNNMIRLKIGVNGKEIDVGAGEAASEVCSEEKIIHGEGKLVREGKDIVDGLVRYCIDFSIDNLLGMIIQTSGLSGEISSVRIINPQIYIAIPCQKVYIPR